MSKQYAETFSLLVLLYFTEQGWGSCKHGEKEVRYYQPYLFRGKFVLFLF
jgi:hypothetical protein